jgi:hypothetical protein
MKVEKVKNDKGDYEIKVEGLKKVLKKIIMKKMLMEKILEGVL